MKILGVETSCDETAVALYDSTRGLIGHCLYSQATLHDQFGGVVPELASRDHVQKILPLTESVLREANCQLKDLNGIGYTKGPGLMGALLVGASFAKSLAYGLKIPTIPVHHLEAHLLAVMLETDKPSYPFVALLVSGGHTLLAKVNGLGCYELLGETIDDAVGEAFDKTAKLLGLPYPGGALLAAMAEKGVVGQYRFPRPMIERPGFDFSFSGLKTHVAKVWMQSTQSDTVRADIANAFQAAVVDTLVIKCRRAMEQTGLDQLVVAGGVGANQALRHQLRELLEKKQGRAFFPRPTFCTDNAAMVAYTAWAYWQQSAKKQDPLAISVKARWPINQINDD